MRVGSDYQANIPEFDPGRKKRCIPPFKNLTDCGSLGTPVAPNIWYIINIPKVALDDLKHRMVNNIFLNQ